MSETAAGKSLTKERPLANNRLYHREQLVQSVRKSAAGSGQANLAAKGKKKKSRRNAHDGFEYAIQPDGQLLGEHLWKENQEQRKTNGFGGRQQQQQQQQPPLAASQMKWTLNKLKAELGASQLRHDIRSKLPPEPVVKPKQIISLYEPTPKDVPSSSFSPTKTHSQNPPLKENSRENSQPEKSFNPYSNKAGQSKTPADVVSSTSCSFNNSYSYSKPNPQPFAATSQPHPQINPTTCHSNHQVQSRPARVSDAFQDDEFADDLDDVLANIDENSLVTSKPATQPFRRVTTSDEVIDVDVDEIYSGSSGTGHVGFDYGDASYSANKTSSNNHYNQPDRFVNDTDTTAAPLCPGHNLPCRILTSRTEANNGRQFYKCSVPAQEDQCEFFEWADQPNDGGFQGNNSHQPPNPSYNNGNTSYNTNDPYGDATGSDSAPLCPGHNLPCKTLTAKTAANSGRQFYACPVPAQDDRCDFFEWVDGGAGTANNSTTTEFSSNWVQKSMPGGPPPTPLAGCKDIHAENKRVFGHKSFRPGQQGIIQQAVSGKDVFVLMPTGGGKSLCYQLPAWCCPGLSVVISPLLSLIQDQVQSMTKLGVTSVFINSSQDYETEQRVITRQLNATTATSGVKLLYLTPEKLRHSTMIQGILSRLYQNNLLSRFVIDEAHCLSDWGHDFRPDYSNLNILRESYPNVPIMALTATANEKVVLDAIRALRMKEDCYRYKSSFNRPNLHYEVRKKDNKAEDSICDYIVRQYTENSHASGVIYCLSRKDCEKLSESLTKKLRERSLPRIKVSFYHADLDATERQRRHSQWSNGTLSVLCATIAFGMGIDKPDVRFVIHYSMPKSITHYYQESGRAGRDGERADCILYYSYKDKQILEGMIKKSAADPYGPSTRRKIDQLYTCLRYCENDFECRRTLQLQFFGESFCRTKCRGTCDNCRAAREIDNRDLTDAAKALLNLLASVQAQKKKGLGVTLLQLTELFRGSKAKSATKFLNLSRLRGYGDAAKFNLKKKQDIDRVAHAMIYGRVITETSEQNGQGYSTDYVQPGEHATAICNGGRRFYVEFAKDQKKAAAKRSKSPKKKAATRKKRSSSSSAKSEKNPEVYALFDEDDGDDDEDAGVDGQASGSDPTGIPAVLPPDATLELQRRIRKVVTMWADEERLMGNNVYYWHIMKNEVIKTVAHQCPTTLDELKALDGLGEQKFKEYGERLMKIIQNFVQTENMEPHLEKKRSAQGPKKRKAELSHQNPPSKAAKGSVASSKSAPANPDDEFPMDDFPDLDGVVLPY